MKEALLGAKDSFDSMVIEAGRVFDAFEKGEATSAGGHMARMDQHLSRTMDTLATLEHQVRREQENEFRKQCEIAEVRHSWTWVLGLALCLSAAAMGAHGVRLSRALHVAHGALARRHSEMALLLDNASQGFATMALDGELIGARSAAFNRLLEPPVGASRLPDVLRPMAPTAAAELELGLDAIRADLLPLELNLEQLPSQIQRSSRYLSMTYRPITQGERLQSLLVVVTDITANVEREHMQAQHRELLSIAESLARDRGAVIDFFGESSAMIEALSTTPEPRTLALLVHTLKGGAGLFGLQTIVAACHHVEQQWTERPPSSDDIHPIIVAWDELMHRLDALMTDRRDVLPVPIQEYEGLVAKIASDMSKDTILAVLASWKQDPIRRRFERMGRQALQLAARLGKPAPAIEIEDHGLKLPPDRWRSFWQAYAHVVRNAIDHGLEHESTRLARGKPSTGKLRFEAHLSDTELMLSLSDDGAGIDWKTVRRRASAKGLPHATQADLEAALLADGFSTRDEATEISGRGIGMFAVRTEVIARGGYLVIESELGRGTTIRCHFPRAAGDLAGAATSVSAQANYAPDVTGAGHGGDQRAARIELIESRR
jgi:two-component system chemotaxis sensor kinase CheA